MIPCQKIILGLLCTLVSDTMARYWYFPTSTEKILGNTDVKQTIGAERAAGCSLWVMFYVSIIRHKFITQGPVVQKIA